MQTFIWGKVGEYLSPVERRLLFSTSKPVEKLSYLALRPVRSIIRDFDTVHMFVRLPMPSDTPQWCRRMVCLKPSGVHADIEAFAKELDNEDIEFCGVGVPYVDLWHINGADDEAAVTRVHKYKQTIETAVTNLPWSVFNMYDPAELGEMELPLMRNRWLYQQSDDGTDMVCIGGASPKYGQKYLVKIQLSGETDEWHDIINRKHGRRVRLEVASDTEVINKKLLDRLDALCVRMGAYFTEAKQNAGLFTVCLHVRDPELAVAGPAFLVSGAEPAIQCLDITFWLQAMDGEGYHDTLSMRQLNFWLINMLSALQLEEVVHLARIDTDPMSTESELYALTATGWSLEMINNAPEPPQVAANAMQHFLRRVWSMGAWSGACAKRDD